LFWPLRHGALVRLWLQHLCLVSSSSSSSVW
jgi:hypothetical protein